MKIKFQNVMSARSPVCSTRARARAFTQDILYNQYNIFVFGRSGSNIVSCGLRLECGLF